MGHAKKSGIRVMSFNIKCKAPDDGENGWEYRKQKTIGMLSFHRPDIAGLQEVFKEQLNDLENSLQECYSWVGVGREDGKEKGEFCPVFYRNDILRPVFFKTSWLSETPNHCGSVGWDGTYPRIVTQILFEMSGSGEVFYFYNTHLDNIGKGARKNGALQLLDMIAVDAVKKPVIITGDFNTPREGEAYRVMTGKDGGSKLLYDAEYISEREHHGPSTTSHNFGKSCEPTRIDYIFVNKLVRVLNHAILADHWDGWYPSDHMPVVADIVLNSEK
jgi:endonuclease/exonuclease/phosphatase family metal-dependent hydrolase